MKNALQKIILVSTLFALSGCSYHQVRKVLVKPQANTISSLKIPRTPTPSEEPISDFEPTPNTPPPTITRVEIQQLTDKIKQAEFTLMAFNDKEFIEDVLKNKKVVDKEVSEEEVTCVYNKLNREKYASEIPAVTQYLAKNYPRQIDNYIGKLDILIPIVSKIYKYPKPVRFNPNDFSNSSALAILTPQEASDLTDIIMNPDYAPLLATIGLPAVKVDGTIEDISLMQIDSIMEYIDEAWGQCQ